MSVTGLDFGITVPPDRGTREYKDYIQEAVGG
jgi:hypothetical protein